MQKILLGIGAFLIGSSLYGFKKVQDYEKVLDQLTVEPEDIGDFGGSTLQKLAFSIKLKIVNPTQIAVNLTTIGLVTVKEIFAYDGNGKEIANVAVNKSQINIPARGYSITGWLPVEIPLSNALNTVASIFTNGFAAGLNPNQFKYKVKINIAGVGDYIIG